MIGFLIGILCAFISVGIIGIYEKIILLKIEYYFVYLSQLKISENLEYLFKFIDRYMDRHLGNIMENTYKKIKTITIKEDQMTFTYFINLQYKYNDNKDSKSYSIGIEANNKFNKIGTLLKSLNPSIYFFDKNNVLIGTFDYNNPNTSKLSKKKSNISHLNFLYMLFNDKINIDKLNCNYCFIPENQNMILYFDIVITK